MAPDSLTPRAVPQVTGRPPTAEEAKRRSRAGDLGRKGSARYVWEEVRNGWPDFKPYIWRRNELGTAYPGDRRADHRGRELAQDPRARTRPERAHPEQDVNHAALQKAVTDLCDRYGLWWHHETDSRKSRAGWVDLVILGEDKSLFVELKSEDGRRTRKQRDCAGQLIHAGLQYRLWRPADLGEIEHELNAMAWHFREIG
jgi:hypothetical protein